MKKKNIGLICLALGIVFCIISCGKISQWAQKDYSGNYINYSEAPLVIRRNPDKTFWITYGTYGNICSQAQISGNRISFTLGSGTAVIIISADGKTLSSEQNAQIIPDVGRKVDDPQLWSNLESYMKQDYKTALVGFQNYLAAHPQDTFIQLCFINCLLQEGKLSDAKTELTKLEKNPDIQSNPFMKRTFAVDQYTLIGKEKSAAGLNAWDGYKAAIDIAVAAPQGLPENIYKDIFQIQQKQGPISSEERGTIEQYIFQNQPAIRKFLSLPEKSECYITSASQTPENTIPYVLRTHTLSKAVVLYGRLKAEDGNIQEAADAYRRVVRMGQQMMQGTLIHQLTGVAIRAIGEDGFNRLFNEDKIVRASDAQYIYEVLRQLRKSDPVSTQDSMLALESHTQMVNENSRISLVRAHTTETKLILLETIAAIKLYQLKEKKSPDSLQTLVPNYLSGIPMDTFAKNSIIYKSSPAFMVYSYGPDTTDDGGQIQYDPTNGALSNGDMVIP